MTAEVLVEIKTQNMDKTFTYKVSIDMEDKVSVGKRVLVPFGNQKLEGFVMSISNDKKFDYELKNIIDVIDSEPVLDDEMLKIGKYMSSKTLANLISCYSTMLPKALKASHKTNINKKYITYLKINKDNLDKVKTEKQKEIIALFDKAHYNHSSREFAFEYEEIVGGLPIVYSYQKLKETISQEEKYQMSDIRMIWSQTRDLMDAIKDL